MDKKEQAKERMRRMRERNKSVTMEGPDVTQTGQSVTENVTQYPAVVLALVDPIKRAKLERITSALEGRTTSAWTGARFEQVPQSRCVTYGIGGPDLERVSELLNCTEGVTKLIQ